MYNPKYRGIHSHFSSSSLPVQQNPSSSANQEISHSSCNPKIYYCVYNSPLLFTSLRQIKLVHLLQLHFSDIYLNIILLPTPTAS